MCTVSWLRQPGGYVLFCNRDERRTRKPAFGPRAGTLRGIAYVAPVDQDQGGSWIGTNQFGVTLCLLNRYHDSPAPDGLAYTSRGWLLRDLLDSKESNELHKRVQSMDLERFQPFTLAILSSREPLMRIDWTGRECLVQADAEEELPLCSSSFDDDRVNRLRREQLKQMISERGQLDAEVLKQFHCSHLPESGPISVCMHRQDACTVSLSMVKVDRKSIEFFYYPASPCAPAKTEKLAIARKTKLLAR
ncbi:MAG TPA: NRDE family protein [Pyrinomonadaceae bacterium]|nr:NRDE family protein [Pyrinomonadaceae bacterium]